MRLQFNLEYRTGFGEHVALNFLDENGRLDRHTMQSLDGLHWQVEMKCLKDSGTYMDYYYSVMRGEKEMRHEWLVEPHRLELAAVKGAYYTVNDHWLDMPEDSYMYSSAFTDCVMARKRQLSTKTEYDHTIRLKVRAPQLRNGERLALVGSADYLGCWNCAKALPMAEHECHEWVVSLDADRLPERTEYKFVILPLDRKQALTVIWENCENRILEKPELVQGQVMVYELPQAWFSIPMWKGAGTVIPVFSLRSEGSFGVGDFGDLKMMVDWCAKTHQSILQILPINDTVMSRTWQDSYPYNAISIYALHPQYMDLRQLPKIKDEALNRKYEEIRQELNALPQIDYERMSEAKMAYLQIIFEQERAGLKRRASYKQFFEANREWLEPYARFCYYRDKFGTAVFSTWPEKLPKPEQKVLDFWYFVQYHLDKQMHDVHTHARKQRVILKGDIPIGISRDGVEAWVEPRYFNLNGQAGAPPDAFCEDGQNWGFPTYNWEEMFKDGCSWWVRRFRKMAEYFDAYRIDHVLGFFRIWEIPIDSVHGLLGQFSPALSMTVSEIEAYGLPFREQFFTEPYISDDVVDQIFKEHAQQVRETYLEAKGDGLYRMKPEFDTQRKVEKIFAGKTDDVSIMLRDGLYALISDVLFVRDHRDATKFHPRIAVQLDFIYKTLSEHEKYVFNKLYDDYFYRRNNQFWYREAMRKLPRLVDATRMLVCAEDLGMVPDCVSWVMNELKILSLELQSMPKDPSVTFGHLSRNPYRSVCTISSHDMPTLRQWWDEDYKRTQEYYNTMLYRGGEAPHPLPGWLARDIISRHLTSPSMLCILAIQDWLAIDERIRLADQNAERINIPANPRHYWRYRMHLNIEQLLADDKFNDNITELVSQSGRR